MTAEHFKTLIINQLPKIFHIPDVLIARIIALLVPGRYRNADRENCHENRLLIDCSYLYKFNLSTGIQRVVRNVVKYSQAYATEKSMTILPVALEHGHFIEIDINIKRSNHKLTWLFPHTDLFLRIIRHAIPIYKTDTLLMLDSSWDLNIWPSIDVFKQKGGKIIGIVHDLIPVSNPEFVDDSTGRSFRQWLIKSLDYYDDYIAVSQIVMNNLRNYIMASGRDVAKYKLDYFRLGADFNINRATSQTSIREPLTAMFAQNKSVYIAVSTIEPRKNHVFLIKAFNRLWEENTDVTLCIIGKIGWKVKDLIAEIRTHPLFCRKLFMWNDLNDDELAFCYRNAKMSLFPSFIEGFGLPIIESLNHGLPVLASNTPIHREVGQDMIDYFDLNSIDELIRKIKQVETVKTIPPQRAVSLPIVTWEQSAHQLLDKVYSLAQH